MFNNKIKNNYLFFLMLNAFLLMTFLFFSNKIFAKNDQETKKATQQNVNELPEGLDIVGNTCNSLSNKINIGSAKVMDELKAYAYKQHSDKTSQKAVQNVVNDIIDNYLNIECWSDVKVDRFKKFDFDGDWMKSLMSVILTQVVSNSLSKAEEAYDSDHSFIFESFTSGLASSVSDSISSLWAKL